MGRLGTFSAFADSMSEAKRRSATNGTWAGLSKFEAFIFGESDNYMINI